MPNDPKVVAAIEADFRKRQDAAEKMKRDAARILAEARARRKN